MRKAFDIRTTLFVVVVATAELCGCREGREAHRKAVEPLRVAAETPHALSLTKGTKPDTQERTVDRLVLEWLHANRQPKAEEIPDALPNEAFRLSAACEPGSRVWEKLKIDLDRDGNVDEKWKLSEGGPGTKRVSTNDDGRFDREERWRDGRWVRKRGRW